MHTQAFLPILTLFVSWIYVTMAANDTIEEPVNLHLTRKDSSPSSLIISWQLPDGYEIETFNLTTQKKDSDSLIIGPVVNGPVSEYTIPDLMTKSKYKVCMDASLQAANVSSELPPLKVNGCANMSTPPRIRPDSILVLFAVLGYVLLMVLLGYLCWRYAHKKQQHSEDDEEETEPIEDKMDNGESRPFLLNSPPPASEPKRPRSAIEDADIPFITPTWDQIASERKPAP